MPREKGSKNLTYYRYEVYDTKIDKNRYYITQEEILDDYKMCRSTCYFLRCKPDRPVDPKYKHLTIKKLSSKVKPVYESKPSKQMIDGNYCVMFNKIDYDATSNP